MRKSYLMGLIITLIAVFPGLQACSSSAEDDSIGTGSVATDEVEPSPYPSETPTAVPPTAVPPTPVSSPTPFPTFRDDFNQELEDGWEWLNELEGGWNLTNRPGFLHIEVPVNERQLLVRKAPEGDFVITTRVLARPKENFLSSGLIILQDDGHVLMYHRGYAYFPNESCCIGNGLYFDNIDTDLGLPEAYYAIDPISPTKTSVLDEAYLRLTREGTTYTAYYSEDGDDWTIIGIHEVDWEPVYVGLHTRGDQNTIPVDADFDFFLLEDLSQYSERVNISEAPALEGAGSGVGYSVYGNFQLSFVPYNDQAELPELPIDLTLVIEPEGGGSPVLYQITDPQGGFSLDLDPGNYMISSVEVYSPSISDNPATLMTGSPSFSVIEGACVYIGRISVSYYRFPPGDYLQQNEWISEFSAQIGREVYAIIFSSGSLIPESGNIDLPDESTWPEGAEDCPLLGAQW